MKGLKISTIVTLGIVCISGVYFVYKYYHKDKEIEKNIKEWKNEGNNHFRSKEYTIALELYLKCYSILKNKYNTNNILLQEYKNILNNISIVYFILKKYTLALEYLDILSSIDKYNIKMLKRKYELYNRMGNHRYALLTLFVLNIKAEEKDKYKILANNMLKEVVEHRVHLYYTDKDKEHRNTDIPSPSAIKFILETFPSLRDKIEYNRIKHKRTLEEEYIHIYNNKDNNEDKKDKDNNEDKKNNNINNKDNNSYNINNKDNNSYKKDNNNKKKKFKNKHNINNNINNNEDKKDNNSYNINKKDKDNNEDNINNKDNINDNSYNNNINNNNKDNNINDKELRINDIILFKALIEYIKENKEESIKLLRRINTIESNIFLDYQLLECREIKDIKNITVKYYLTLINKKKNINKYKELLAEGLESDNKILFQYVRICENIEDNRVREIECITDGIHGNETVVIEILCVVFEYFYFIREYKMVDKILSVLLKYNDARVSFFRALKCEIDNCSPVEYYLDAIEKDSRFFKPYLFLGNYMMVNNNMGCIEYIKKGLEVAVKKEDVYAATQAMVLIELQQDVNIKYSELS